MGILLTHKTVLINVHFRGYFQCSHASFKNICWIILRRRSFIRKIKNLSFFWYITFSYKRFEKLVLLLSFLILFNTVLFRSFDALSSITFISAPSLTRFDIILRLTKHAFKFLDFISFANCFSPFGFKGEYQCIP